mmetsp:Transcript_25515/g.72886  ORF Transcript_25515/g.72886 Transcript_25515/m.72886 type:complete len:210 (-) Transcript_25515:15-644(-)
MPSKMSMCFLISLTWRCKSLTSACWSRMAPRFFAPCSRSSAVTLTRDSTSSSFSIRPLPSCNFASWTYCCSSTMPSSVEPARLARAGSSIKEALSILLSSVAMLLSNSSLCIRLRHRASRKWWFTIRACLSFSADTRVCSLSRAASCCSRFLCCCCIARSVASGSSTFVKVFLPTIPRIGLQGELGDVCDDGAIRSARSEGRPRRAARW